MSQSARSSMPKVVFGFSLVTAISTWVMLLIGGTVNPTGSSLACDWGPKDLIFPTCNGEAFPEMVGGVLFEHGHRLWGWLVGFFTVLTFVGTLVTKGMPRSTKMAAGGALLFVLLQGALGGLTVYFGLNRWLSTAHLVCGYSFLAWSVVLAWRLAPSRFQSPHLGATLPRNLLLLTTVLLFGQLILGGMVRHFGAGFICGDDAVGCAGTGFWPELPAAQMHMFHRFVAYALTIWMTILALKTRAQALAAQRPAIARLALLPIFMVLLQVALGLLTVLTRHVAVVAMHTAIGGLLLAIFVSLWVGFGPLGEPRHTSAGAPQ